MRPRPMVRYVANLDGSSILGREMVGGNRQFKTKTKNKYFLKVTRTDCMQVLALARHLTTNYGQDERVTRLLNTTEVHSP